MLSLLGRPVGRTLRIWAEPWLGGAIAATPMPTSLGFLQALKHYDHCATLPGITAATTIITGGADTLTPAVHGREMAAAIPGSRLIHRPDAGHLVLHDEPQVVADAISDAITAARAAGSAAAQAG